MSGVETYSFRKAFHISGFIGLKLKLHNYDYVIIEKCCLETRLKVYRKCASEPKAATV